MVGVAVAAAIVSYLTYGGGSGPRYDYAGSPGISAGASAPRGPRRMLADVRACTMDAERDASGGIANGACTLLRAGEEIEVQFWFSTNADARAGDRDLQPCVRSASWQREAGVRDPRDSKDCVVIARGDFEEARR
jgi:hypothetical protein